MNRRERRKMERAGKIPKQEPIYSMKPSDIKNAALNGVGKQAMIQEIRQQCLAADREITLDMDTIYLWTLHNKYGWGLKRLKRFYMEVFEEHLKMRERYEMDDVYPQRQRLKEKGIDIESWYDELFDSQGNFKSREGTKT